ncbi:MAG: hypothetical protein ABIH42_09170, partial [Planctomycetota bacterium]
MKKYIILFLLLMGTNAQAQHIGLRGAPLRTKYAVIPGDLGITGNLSVNGKLVVNDSLRNEGTTLLKDDLTVSGNATISGTLGVGTLSAKANSVTLGKKNTAVDLLITR